MKRQAQGQRSIMCPQCGAQAVVALRWPEPFADYAAAPPEIEAYRCPRRCRPSNSALRAAMG